ncbi:hypothetical protein M5X11_12265 [Paenibacillus alginolyticus]|uniref:hypothetical protein n=1 Tax=Paenibacillus alginolyticus TaxID=59839 RepID=UPI0003F51A96|nr:hypothetical protein [Paenibacillus alginolyticus]MCY9665729.1 hypothetical protein [Paenibacillus alginolyticus]
MKYKFDIENLLQLTMNSTGQKLEPNEHIINMSIKDNALLIDTRVFTEDEPIPGDIIRFMKVVCCR